ncbi:enoyl-CoA hydratase/carnithine racemase [Rhodococcus sp. 27YEA15]|uniref:enoyl-CoA hydratase-related protein n=1 Tax=Rhodococcus sp. 27YEA15 TaxID=3156259 RepID=UPI003C7A7089
MNQPEVIVAPAEQGVALITLNRPSELNAWTYSMESTFFEALDNAVGDSDVRAIVITGAGRGFCAGASMSILGTTENPVARPDRATRRRFCELTALPKPTIAAVNGPAAGIGMALALSCDIRIVANNAKLTSSFARLGLVAEHGTAWLLPRLIGLGRATEFLLSGRVMTGTEAEQIGLATSAVAAERVVPTALARARELAATCSPQSWAQIKLQLHRADEIDLSSAYEEAADLMEVALESADHHEGVQAFRERRSPTFAPWNASVENTSASSYECINQRLR